MKSLPIFGLILFVLGITVTALLFKQKPQRVSTEIDIQNFPLETPYVPPTASPDTVKFDPTQIKVGKKLDQ